MLKKSSTSYVLDRMPTSSGYEASDSVFIHGLVLEASIGLYDEEKLKKQPVEISVDMDLLPIDGAAQQDTIVCYDMLSQKIRELVNAGHIYLVETLAEKVADICLAEPRVFRVAVSIGKPDAVTDAQSVGVRIVRSC